MCRCPVMTRKQFDNRHPVHTIFLPSTVTPKPLKEQVFDTGVLFRAEHSGIFCSLQFDQWLISVLIAIKYRSKPL